MRITLVGTGYVGLVTGAVFAERGHEVLCIDKVAEKIELLSRGGMPIYEPGLAETVDASRRAGRLRFSTDIGEGVRSAEVIFLCVDTPPHESGRADLSSVEIASTQIARHLNGYKVIVEKSTVPVKTGERVRQTIARKSPPGTEFDVASNPEFLREGSALADARKPDRIVIGVTSPRAAKLLTSLYEPFGAPVIVTDVNSAEIIKHAANSFLAIKISYINAVSRICELAGADVTEVARGVGLDRRIGASFLSAGLGYGGSCFPKDVAAFHRISQELGYDFRLLEEVQKINEDQRRHVLRKVEEEVWNLKGKRIALLGLSFKPDTDDIRESPGLWLARELAARGAVVCACDPKAAARAVEAMPGLEIAPDPYAAARGAECVILATEWEEFRTLDLKRLKEALAHPVLIDGRNLYDPKAAQAAGLTYRCVGRAGG